MTNAFHFDTLVWDWPIAIYLLLVGISSGMVILAIFLKGKRADIDPARDSVIIATTIISPLSVILGLSILIFHLTKPLTFWYLMVFYNVSSIMSLGVLLFQVYMLVLIVWIVNIYHNRLKVFLSPTHSTILIKLNAVLDFLVRCQSGVEKSLFILAVALGCYTGFLLSALKSYPLLNNPVLPLLFLVSGVTSGVIMIMLYCSLTNKRFEYTASLHFIHKLERPLIYLEALLLCSFFVGLILGGGQKTVAAMNTLNGFWGGVFWSCVVGLGIILPLLSNRVFSENIKQNRKYVVLMAAVGLFSVFSLRIFILYAGQMTVA
ncbi:cytochrome c nitrite reductase subunit NrfD [Edaphovirga cremea]|uniref:cytochrome c nitrite reductase subunit NrfD n=1 Tax=Edaphovirga cremea TaxID=2267246 RepID=UPI000DEF2B6E|nr:cytochrome c nitrite reductase subunit NrfD [Edaphovirga cremea]